MKTNRSNRFRTTVAALAAVAVLLLAACGGSDDTSAGTDGGNGSSNNTSDGSSGGSVPRVGEDIEVGGFTPGFEDCSKLAGAYGALTVGSVMDLFGGGEGEPGGFGDVSIPSELADDFRTLENAYAEFNAQLGGRSVLDAITDPDLAEELDQLGSPVETPEVQQANENIFKFLEKNCTDFVPLPGL